MTLATTTSKVVYTGNGTTGPFTFTFPIYASSDLIVTKYTIADGTETLFVLNTDYTVAGSFTSVSPASGSVTLTSSLSSSYKLIIQRSLAYTQSVDLQENDDLPADTIEKSIADRIVMLVQQIKEVVDRAVVQNAAESSNLIFPILESGKVLGNDGTDLIWEDLVTTSTTYNGTISAGLDAAKPAAPGVRDIYLATDTGKIYVCLTAANWTWYNPNPAVMTTRGDIDYYGASGIARLAASTSGYFLKTLGAGADPAWAEVLINRKVGTFSRDVSLASGSQSVTGIGFAPRLLILFGSIDSGATTWGMTDGTNSYCIYRRPSDGNMFAGSPLIQFTANATPDQATAVLASLDSDGFTLTWTKTNSPTGTANIRYVAVR